MTKPFALDELLASAGGAASARARRRGRPGRLAASAAGRGSAPRSGSKAVRRGERRIDLTAKEFALLAYLMANAGTVVSRAKLLSNVWGMNFDPGTKLVDVYIRYLRRKVDEGEAEPLIQTVRGFGYMVSRRRPRPSSADWAELRCAGGSRTEAALDAQQGRRTPLFLSSVVSSSRAANPFGVDPSVDQLQAEIEILHRRPDEIARDREARPPGPARSAG
jgi:DNA-binding winged helix-turn-helix (wHTH) protein